MYNMQVHSDGTDAVRYGSNVVPETREQHYLRAVVHKQYCSKLQILTCRNNAHIPIISIIVSHSRPQTDHLTACLAVEYCCLKAHVAEEPSERVGGHTNSGCCTIPKPVPCSRMLPCTVDPRNTRRSIKIPHAEQQWVTSGVNGQQSRLLPNRQQNDQQSDQQRRHLGV